MYALLRHTEKNKNQLIISVYLGAPPFGGKQEIQNTKFFAHILFTVQKISSNCCELVRSCYFSTEKKAKLKEEERSISLKEDSKRTPWKPTIVVLLGCARGACLHLVRGAAQHAGCTEARHEGLRGGETMKEEERKSLWCLRARQGI